MLQKNNSTYCLLIGRSKKSNDAFQHHFRMTREKSTNDIRLTILNSLLLSGVFILRKSFVEAIKTFASKSPKKVNQEQEK